MDFLTIHKNINAKTQKTVACIESYTEYIESKIRDIGNFVTDNSTSESYMSVIVSNLLEDKDRVVTLAKSEYQKAMNGDDVISVILPNGDTRSVDAAKIIDSVNTQLTGAQIESQFLQYCKNTKDNISSSDFVSRIQSLVNNVAPTILESYVKILDSAGDKIDAISAFFTLHDNTEVTHNASNNYITIVDGAQYEGSVWSAAGTQILDDISGFFNVVWEGISHIKEFVMSIVDGIAKLGKWFITKMFHNLSTVYEKLGDDPAQVMDLPLLQMDLGELNDTYYHSPRLPVLENWVNRYDYYDTRDASTGDEYHARYNLGSNLKIEQGHSGYQFDNQLSRTLASKLINISLPADGIMSTTRLNKYVSYQVTDMIIPSSPFNLLLRLGVKESNKHAFICMYPCFTKGTLDNDDEDISLMIEQSIQDALINTLIPTTWFARRHPVSSSAVGISYYADRLRAMIIDNVGGHPDTSLYDLLANKMFSISLSDITPSSYVEIGSSTLTLTQADVAMMLMQYVAYVGAGNTKWNVDYNGVPAGFCHITKIPALPWQNSAFTSQFIVIDTSSTLYNYRFPVDSLGNMSDLAKEYIPYNVSNPIPFSIHYQNVSEQAQEIVHLFWAAIAVVAITVVAVKVVRWKKTRINTGTLLQADRDRLSWDYCANPTAENRQKFLKAQKKFRRFDKLNKILGLSSSADDIYNLVVPASDDALQQILSRLGGPQTA